MKPAGVMADLVKEFLDRRTRENPYLSPNIRRKLERGLK